MWFMTPCNIVTIEGRVDTSIKFYELESPKSACECLLPKTQSCVPARYEGGARSSPTTLAIEHNFTRVASCRSHCARNASTVDTAHTGRCSCKVDHAGQECNGRALRKNRGQVFAVPAPVQVVAPGRTAGRSHPAQQACTPRGDPSGKSTDGRQMADTEKLKYEANGAHFHPRTPDVVFREAQAEM
jgi:hypothetical protein